MQQVSSAAFTDTKPHYELLDGLRGIAAYWYYGIMCKKDLPLLEEHQ